MRLRPASAAIIIATALLSGCLSAQEIAQQNFNQDVAVCRSFGAEYGSPAHYQCMLVQQQRRDYQSAVANAQFQYNVYQLQRALQ